MSLPIVVERRLLTASEFEAVERSHYPALCGLSKPELIGAARTLREFRDKARDVSRGRRREMRGKAEPRGATSAPDDSGLAQKKQIFVSALKRVNREIARHEQTSPRLTLAESARRALAMKQANSERHHPAPGRTRRKGMRPVEHDIPRTQVDPRQVGRVSQQNKDHQARRDA